jgi:hypothetical protein
MPTAGKARPKARSISTPRVKPHWAGRVRVAQIENHVFYR